MSNKEKVDLKEATGYDYLGKSASVNDCTGLIPFGPVTQYELDSYQDLYDFGPKAVFEKENSEDGKYPV